MGHEELYLSMGNDTTKSREEQNWTLKFLLSYLLWLLWGHYFSTPGVSLINPPCMVCRIEHTSHTYHCYFSSRLHGLEIAIRQWLGSNLWCPQCCLLLSKRLALILGFQMHWAAPNRQLDMMAKAFSTFMCHWQVDKVELRQLHLMPFLKSVWLWQTESLNLV